MENQQFVPGEVTRKITVYNTVGSCETPIQSKAQTWGELKKDLTEKGIPYSNMKAVIGETQEELKSDGQIIGTSELSLFLTPIKVRSGK